MSESSSLSTTGNLIYGTFVNLDKLKDEPLARLAAHFSFYQMPPEFLEWEKSQKKQSESKGEAEAKAEPKESEAAEPDQESDQNDSASDGGEAKVKPEFDLSLPAEPERPQLVLESNVREDLIMKMARKLPTFGFKCLQLQNGRPTMFYYGYPLATVDASQGNAVPLSKFKGHSVTKVQKRNLDQKVKALPKPLKINLRKVQHYAIWSQ